MWPTCDAKPLVFLPLRGPFGPCGPFTSAVTLKSLKKPLFIKYLANEPAPERLNCLFIKYLANPPSKALSNVA
jgi:hypothetical protein